MSLNVLVVDDSSVVRTMVLKTLHMAGLPVGEVHEAGNGKEGLEALNANWIDLVLSDLNMPILDGEEMINRIRANPLWKDLPVVVISTEGSQTRIRRLEEQDVRFIHKPFTPEQIRAVVVELLGLEHEQTTV
jgi:two-component system chemotaxis response regulator CheY